MNLLDVKNLYKTFKGEKEPSLYDISFSLKNGQRTALIGPDGSGKTTLLRLLAGLIPPDNVKNDPILIEGFSPCKNLGEIKKIIGYMPQKFGLYEDLTVIENLELYAGLKNIKGNEKEKSFSELLKFSGLSNFKNRLTGALSGGMKQKLGLSCVLLSKPSLLLLDEPSVGVDPVSRRELIKITDKLSVENNISIIWATSYLDEAKFFENILLLENGKRIYEGTPDNAKRAMEGLTFYTKENYEIRNYLFDIIKYEKGIVDATIEGDKIRVIFEDKNAIKNFHHPLIKTESTFEDFVMSAIETKKPFLLENSKKIEQIAPNNIAIEAVDLCKKYGSFTAANNINFKIKQGEIFGLLGPNGAGKSTTFKMLTGLIKPTKGSSKIMGVDINENPIEAKKNFGYMAQKFSLFGNLSVKQNIEFFMGVYGVKKKINEIIKGYNIEKYLEYSADNLPLGYKQRLSLLCATISNPPVLFLDEPTSGVDPNSRREFWMRINNFVKNNSTVLVTTHFMDEAQFCDNVALVYKGEILVKGTPDELKNMAKTKTNNNPTMEDAFIFLIKEANKKAAG